jgi:hypothetical protein
LSFGSEDYVAIETLAESIAKNLHNSNVNFHTFVFLPFPSLFWSRLILFHDSSIISYMSVPNWSSNVVSNILMVEFVRQNDKCVCFVFS